MGLVLGAQGVNAGLRGQAANRISLQAGACYIIPAGSWEIRNGLYSTIQQYDVVSNIWRSIGDNGRPMSYINSDGVNFRVANQTGCVVGALMTNAGTGYTSAPAVAASAGGSVMTAIVGGAVNTSVTVNNGGANYVYPPVVVFDAPPLGQGVQAEGYCTLSAGAVSTVTITDQGAGYTNVPNVYFKNDPRDTTGAGALATAALTGAGTITAVLVNDHGTPLTSLPTFSFSGGGGSSAAATCLMCWTITGYTVSVAGSGYAGAIEITGLGGNPGSGTGTNPATQLGLVRRRRASIQGALSGVGITATGQTVDDGGIYEGAPTALIIASPIVTLTTAATIALTMGGANDGFDIYPA